MRINLLAVLILVVLLLSAACNRFENTFEPQDVEAAFVEWIDNFGSQLEESLSEQKLDELMAYYEDDYLHNGMTKEDVKSYFRSLAEQEPDQVEVEIDAHDFSAMSFTFSLLVSQEEQVLADTTIVEFTTEKDSDYLLFGNQQQRKEGITRRVLIELFTARLCPNCPYVEAALYNLKQRMGNLFFYIEYHMQNPLNFGHQDIAGYYGVTSQPTGIVQGAYRVRGGSEDDSVDDYEHAISQFLDLEEEFFFRDFEYQAGADEILFTVNIEKLTEEVPDNLRFKYALIDKVSSYNNLQGEPFRNVVISKDELELTPDMFNGSALVEARIEVPDFEFNYPAVVVWIQTIEEIYDEETCRVHNVYEYEIEL